MHDIFILFHFSRGISKSSIDSLQPLPERPEEQLSYYGKLPATRRDSFDEFPLNTSGIDSPLPLESERSSFRDDLDSGRNHSELSDSNTWSVCTGNLTGRSSVNSWGNDDVSVCLFVCLHVCLFDDLLQILTWISKLDLLLAVLIVGGRPRAI